MKDDMTIRDEYLDFVNHSLDEGKFKVFVRYMVCVAENKRCVTYRELEQIFGLGHDYVGWFAGILGFYCNYPEWPMLNSLIINSTDCVPSNGFTDFEQYTNKSWGELIAECWKYFHVKYAEDNKDNYSGLDTNVADFIVNFENYYDKQNIH